MCIRDSHTCVASPQHATSPVARTTHVWYAPAEIDLASVIPLTVTTPWTPSVPPSPSCPCVASPQQPTVPPRTAHAWTIPTATAVASESDTTGCGEGDPG